jgi:hypothetical protein
MAGRGKKTPAGGGTRRSATTVDSLTGELFDRDAAAAAPPVKPPAATRERTAGDEASLPLARFNLDENLHCPML